MGKLRRAAETTVPSIELQAEFGCGVGQYAGVWRLVTVRRRVDPDDFLIVTVGKNGKDES